jgi:uncharacterized RDD family membrane protein YckC
MSSSPSPPPPPDPFAPPQADLHAPPADGPRALGGRGARLGAYLLDMLLYAPFFGLGIWLRSRHYVDEITLAGTPIVNGVALACMLPMVLFQWYLVSTTGQSIGKRWLGLAIVRLDGTPVDLMSGAILRSLVPFLLYRAIMMAGLPVRLVQILTLVDSLFIFSGSRRTLHDRFARTMVIELPGRKR